MMIATIYLCGLVLELESVWVKFSYLILALTISKNSIVSHMVFGFLKSLRLWCLRIHPYKAIANNFSNERSESQLIYSNI